MCKPYGMTFQLLDNFEYFLVIFVLVRYFGLGTNLSLAAQSVDEWSVWEETIFIFWIGQFSEESKSIFFGDLISQVGQDVFKLSQHHGSILVFVVQFAQFDVVMVVATHFWGLHGSLDHFDDFIEAGVLLFFFFLLAICHADLLGNVEAQGVHDITKIEQVELALAMPIVNVADFLNSISISHFDGFLEAV